MALDGYVSFDGVKKSWFYDADQDGSLRKLFDSDREAFKNELARRVYALDESAHRRPMHADELRVRIRDYLGKDISFLFKGKQMTGSVVDCYMDKTGAAAIQVISEFGDGKLLIGTVTVGDFIYTDQLIN